ncbi:hypothetical protein J19TS2_31050 [Cohnella xylanilytica]|uniref:hypothetical protein n=1 Tax=Cohnella xylanilytica TaxID=557555 RepID=UPI001B00CF18|nr:hypothetical protein [Cohnella xylanilytica]GIO13550.1 hypothetical protein J19TS2_31050 [Cohnella xylanilytica]
MRLKGEINVKVKIKETGELDTLVLMDSNGINWVRDFIGNVGALNDGQFVYDQEEDVHVVSQEDYEWWSNTIQLHQRLNDRIEELSQEHGRDAVDEALQGIDMLDLDVEAKAMLAALDEAFGEMAGN